MKRRSLFAFLGLGATAAVLPEIAPESAPKPCYAIPCPAFEDVTFIPPSSGGWCAPSSDVIWGLTTDQVNWVDFELPEISVRRGGLQFPVER